MDKKISALDLVTVLDTGDVLPIVNQATTKKVTVAKLIDGLATTTYVDTKDALKVDKVTGKGLSTEDYTTTEKSKLAGIEAGAEVNVNADWNAVSGDALILNKPTIPSVTGFVPYTGATSDVNLGEFGIQLGNLEFDNTPTTIPTTAGSMYYNDSDGTLDLILKGGNVTLQLGQETVIRVVNKTATNVSLLQSNYQAVRITGAQGQRPKVDLAQATNDVLSAETIGLVTETIDNNQEGFITTSGLVRNINTTGSIQGETWLDGDVLYLSPTVAGRITKVKPIAPNHLVIIGYVIYAHATQGTIFVKVDNGYELDELHNVKINGATNNEVLAYTLATDIWENKTLSEVGIQPTITLTTTGTSGASTLIGDTLNIPQYSGGGSSTQSAFTILANNTNASAVPTEQVYIDVAEQTYSGTITWSTTAPTTILSNTYQWQQVGSLVTVRLSLSYSTAGTNVTVTIPLPTDLPTPLSPTGFTGASDILYYGIGMFNTTTTTVATTARNTFLKRNSTNTGYEFIITAGTAISIRVVHLTLQYFT